MKKIVKNLLGKEFKHPLKVTVVILCCVSTGLLATTSCVKQKNCEAGLSGTFVYLEEPYKKSEGQIFGGKEEKIVAHFLYGDQFFFVHGHIPSEFHSTDSLKVKVLLRRKKRAGMMGMVYSRICSLKCIEKEN